MLRWTGTRKLTAVAVGAATLASLGLTAAPAGAVSDLDPTVTINQTAGQADPATTSPIRFTVTFSEPVSGFDGSDVTFSDSTAGGSLVATVEAGGGPSVFIVDISGMTTTGKVIASIPAGAAINEASQPSAASTSTDHTVTWAPVVDDTDPTVTINRAAGQTDPTSRSPIVYTVTFSEPVSGFDQSDVELSGSTAGGTLVATMEAGGGPSVFKIDISGMTTAGNVVATIPAGAAFDAASNPSKASTSTDNAVAWSTDTTPPDVSVNQAVGQHDPTSTSPIRFWATFSEAVTGFTHSDVSLAGSTAGGTLKVKITGGPTVYVIAVSGMTTSGIVTASIPAGAVVDDANNPSTASTSSDNTVSWHKPAAPTTRITKHTIKARTGSATFRFAAKGHATGFQCALVKHHAKPHFTACRSPKRYSHLAKGSYTFEVRAVGPGGRDRTPAKRTFTSRK